MTNQESTTEIPMAARSPRKITRTRQMAKPLKRALPRKPTKRTSLAENVASSASEDSETDTQVIRAPKRGQAKGRSTARKAAPKKQKKEATPVDVTDDDDGPDDPKEYDSDALDDDSDDLRGTKRKGKKASSSPRKRRRTKAAVDDDPELSEGQEIIGKVVEAPKTGHVPAGQISGNTLNFLRDLKKPECNDRQWFKLHEPVYRAAEKEWKAFIEAFTDLLAEVDAQVPHLPPNDVVHRIYRDIRFSNDKTPYKTGFSASFSRSGRKGIFAGLQVIIYLISLSLSVKSWQVKPGGESLIAAGSWCPGKNELATIRANILRNPDRLRQVISEPEFVQWFGAAEPSPDGERSNIFGMEDELKVAPKGIDKNHKDIDLLKCRSFAVVHRFLDTEVLDPEFKNKLADVSRVTMPFVHCLNDMMTVPPDDGDGDEDQDEQESGHGSE